MGSTGEAKIAKTSVGMQELTVVTWNCLAHIHTHWDVERHHGKPKSLETAAQMLARHHAIVSRLRALQPDCALLQEVDEHFMPRTWQQDAPLPCGQMLEGYVPYRSYSDRGEGTVVLLRSATLVRDTSVPTAYLPPSEAHGWKTGVVVHARRVGAGSDSQPIAFGSVHLRWGAPQQQATLLAAALGARQHGAVPMVMGGDFNARVPQLASERIDAALLAAGLVRVPADAPTGLGNGGTIDHLYAVGVRLSPPEVGALPPLPRGPWTEDVPHDGSDHAWVSVRVSL